MKTSFALALIGSVIALSTPAAHAAGSPDSAVKKVIKEAQKGSYASFRQHLVGRAGQEYGSNAMFDLIHTRIANFKKLETHHSLVSSDHGYRVYEVDVYGKNPRNSRLDVKSAYVITASVQCAVDQNYDPGFCYGGWGWGWGWGMGDCFPGGTYTTENCSVTALRDAQPN